MFAFVFAQMTETNMQSCNKFDSSMIFITKNIIEGWADKFQDIFFESTKASDILNVMVKIVPLENSWGKKKNFWKSYVLYWKGECFQYF